MAKYYKFYLHPGQQPPEGATSLAMTDGGIVWIGDKWTTNHLEAREMSLAELQEYNDFLEYQKIETQFEITFEQFRSKTTLDQAKAEIISKMSMVKEPVKIETVGIK